MLTSSGPSIFWFNSKDSKLPSKPSFTNLNVRAFTEKTYIPFGKTQNC